MTVIQIENLWKEYRLGVIGHGTLTHDLESWWARVRGKEDPNAKIAPMMAGQEKQIDGDHFWALRDINLEVKEGEILGIIGKNGAGKSTLLKILSRVTAPTKGNIKVKGRIASLLEVGTGFHPELTGRENIFMNGAILGMSKQEIKSKLDEIIDFSGVEAFVDTPVKRYSSGMYVRLAFAVAAHLEPEILIIDEVLAVGDANFQKKCLGKMREVSKEGRTVLFVSHNLPMISKLCSKCVLLSNGKVLKVDNTEEIIRQYMEDSFQTVSSDVSEVTDRDGAGGLVFKKLKFLDAELNELSVAHTGDPLVIRLYFSKTTDEKYNAVRFSFLIKNMDNGLIFLDTSVAQEKEIIIMDHGFIDFYIERLPLTNGKFGTTLFVEANREVQDWIQNGPPLVVEGGNFFNSGRNCVPGVEGKQVLVDHTVKLSWRDYHELDV